MIYLHGIIRPPLTAGADQHSGGAANPGGMVAYRDIVALVSPVLSGDPVDEEIEDLRRLRQAMRTHHEVLNAALWADGVIPVQFGTVFADGELLLRHFLEPCYELVTAALDRVDGATEVKLKAEYVRDQILQEVAQTEPGLLPAAPPRGKARIAGLDARIDLGRRVVEAIERRRNSIGGDLLGRLAACSREVSLREPSSELTVLDASFLVESSGMNAFDEEVNRMADQFEERGRLTCIGPLPPYSFVDLRIGDREG